MRTPYSYDDALHALERWAAWLDQDPAVRALLRRGTLHHALTVLEAVRALLRRGTLHHALTVLEAAGDRDDRRTLRRLGASVRQYGFTWADLEADHG